MAHGETSAVTAINQEFNTCAKIFDEQSKRQTTTKKHIE
jgi:hypothetical protein